MTQIRVPSERRIRPAEMIRVPAPFVRLLSCVTSFLPNERAFREAHAG